MSIVGGNSYDNEPVWEGNRALTLPRLTGEQHADVCVVGLGGSGLSAVLELLSLGRNVVGVDAGQVAAGAAGRNGGLLLAGLADFHHDAVAALGRERAVALYRGTLDALSLELERGWGSARRVGSLRIAASAAELADCRAQLERMRLDGLSVESYQGAEGDGLLFPDDAVFNPLQRCREMAQRALELGARLYQDSPVTSVGEGLVECAPSAGEDGPVGGTLARVRCGAVIVAIDGRLEQLLPELSPRVRTARLQMLATAVTDELPLARPVYRRYGFEYYQRTPAGRIALGGFRDHGGAGEWTGEAVPTPLVQTRLERFLRDDLGVTAPITHRWAASVGYSARSLPLREEVRPGVWAVGGYSGTGNLIGAVLGRASARVACGLPSSEWELFG